MKPLLVAHRGASGRAPENTSAAFDLALEQGADALELDVRPTRDGVLAVWHDVDVARTSRLDGRPLQGSLSELEWDQIQRFDCGSWFNSANPHLARPEFENLRPMSLESVIDAYAHRTSLFIEIKIEDVALATALFIELWRRAFSGDSSRHYVLSEDARTLALVYRAFPDLNLIQVIAGEHGPAWMNLDAIRYFVKGIAPWRSLLDRNLMIAAQHKGLGVYPYTVNNPSELDLLDPRVSGVITDFPGECRVALAELSESEGAIALTRRERTRQSINIGG